MAGLYVVTTTIASVSAIKTLVQIKAGSSRPLEIVRAWVNQYSTTASAQHRVQLVRKTATATVTSFTPLKLDADAPAADAVGGTSATGVDASAEGTDGDVLYEDAFNQLSGWLYLPVPEERIRVSVGGFLGLKLPVAPAAAISIACGVVFREL